MSGVRRGTKTIQTQRTDNGSNSGRVHELRAAMPDSISELSVIGGSGFGHHVQLSALIECERNLPLVGISRHDFKRSRDVIHYGGHDGSWRPDSDGDG